MFNIITGEESWIYQYDPETKRQSSGRKSSNKSEEERRKKMICSFFRTSGHIATVPMEDQRTVTADWFVTKYLTKVFDALRRERSKTSLRGILLHRDNASSHRAHKTTTFQVEQEYKLGLMQPTVRSWHRVTFLFFRKRRIKFAVADLCHLELLWLHMKKVLRNISKDELENSKFKLL